MYNHFVKVSFKMWNLHWVSDPSDVASSATGSHGDANAPMRAMSKSLSSIRQDSIEDLSNNRLAEWFRQSKHALAAQS